MTYKPGDKVGPWAIVEAREVFDNPWIRLIDHKVIHPNGEPGIYGLVHFKNRAIGVLPIEEEGDVWLVGQHRFPHDAYSWELPEGGCPPGEEPLEAAKRELAEETGLAAETWHPLYGFDISNSVTDEVALSFIATGLTQGMSAPEASEALEIRRASFGELLHLVLTGEIRDSLTIVMTLAAHAKALRGELPDAVSKAIKRGLR